MCPRGLAPNHLAAEQILECATIGGPADSGKPLTVAMLGVAIVRDAHPLDREALRIETVQKVEEDYAHLIPWSELKANLPGSNKLSPLLQIPYES
jgi:hypothetical protein